MKNGERLALATIDVPPYIRTRDHISTRG